MAGWRLGDAPRESSFDRRPSCVGAGPCGFRASRTRSPDRSRRFSGCGGCRGGASVEHRVPEYHRLTRLSTTNWVVRLTPEEIQGYAKCPCRQPLGRYAESPSAAKIMNFNSLILERIILEARYENGFLYWDNSGKTVSEIIAACPKLVIRDINISNTQLEWLEENIVANFSSLKADIVQEYPSTLETFKSVAHQLLVAIRERLEITSFTRVGVRYIYLLPTRTSEEADKITTLLPVLTVPGEALKPFGGHLKQTQLFLRIEDQDRGYAITSASVSRNVTARIPRPFSLDTSKFHRYGVTLDVDCYTNKIVESTAFVPNEFIRATQRTLEDNLFKLLGDF